LVILITGGTGTLGHALVDHILANTKVQKLIVYSRDEFKQSEMAKLYTDKRLRFFLGDVRDEKRLSVAMRDVNVVIHAAALKQVPALEYNPTEAIKTNINGADNVIHAAMANDVEKVVALSTDKAVNPINLYGATKLVSDKLFISANAYSGNRTKFNVVRYGNVVGSRGSVLPLFQSIKDEVPVTDYRMTRFWTTIEQAVTLVMMAVLDEDGGKVFVAKSPSFRIKDLATALGKETYESGIRPGEKLHEVMITEEDNIVGFENHYEITPGEPTGFRYASDTNPDIMDVEEIKGCLK